MTNTKWRTDYAKYDVKWNIEFWRKWNAIVMNVLVIVDTTAAPALYIVGQ